MTRTVALSARGWFEMGIRVLLIEDEHEIGDFVTRGLREEGFTVEWAADGDAGWHHLRTAVLGRRPARLVAARAGRPDAAAPVPAGRARHARFCS